VANPVERSDPEGLKGPEGKRGPEELPWRRESAQTTGRKRGVRPVSASKTELSGGVSGRTGLRWHWAWKRRCRSGALTSEWRENVVAGERKAVPSFRLRLNLLLKPFQGTDPLKEKNLSGERWSGIQKRSAADRTPRMQVVRSIVP